MIVQSSRKRFAQPLQVRADDHGVIVLMLKPQEIHPLSEPPPGTSRVQALKLRFDRLMDCLFDTS